MRQRKKLINLPAGTAPAIWPDDEYHERMQGVTPYLLLAMLGAAIAGAGFVAAGAGGSAPENPDLGFYLSAKARSGEVVDPALAVAAGIPDQSVRERALVYAAVRDMARSAGASATAESAIAGFESVRSLIPVPPPR